MANAFNECKTVFLSLLVISVCMGTLVWQPLYSFKVGVQQGDPLGPLLFSLVVLDLLDDIPNEVSNLLLRNVGRQSSSY